MIFSDNQIKKILSDGKYVEDKILDNAEELAKSNNVSLPDYLISEGHVSESLLGQAIAEYLEVPLIDLENTKINESVLGLIPEIVATSKKVIPFEMTGDILKVGMIDPRDREIRYFIEKRVGMRVKSYLITESGFQKVISLYKAGLKSEIKKILDKLEDPTITREEGDQVTVEIVDKILDYGYENKASDIHIEPYEGKVLVRFRIDGILYDVLDMPDELAELIITRIKVISRMRTDERRAAQDGKFRYKPKTKNDESVVDVRVSVLPVTKGENVVMRILSSEGRKFNLQDIGFGYKDVEKLKKSIKNPHGMILVTGPTGSGKTTTLYSVLKILNNRSVHISTIEDPVEYDIEGVSQIQVNPKTNLTFAKGLRAIVRQDPDIIMVGEIRDDETAGIAVNSAMTGHLVLSTLHTNDAATTLPRLADMKIEPFLIASTVNIVIAQRLVRKICKSCMSSVALSDEEKKFIKESPKIMDALKKKKYKSLDKLTLFHGSGCKVCNNTGYKGRIGIFEVLEMSPEIKRLVQKNASSDEIIEKAVKNGMTTILEDGIEKILVGVTTFDEVLRVAHQPN